MSNVVISDRDQEKIGEILVKNLITVAIDKKRN
jgi:hypothetical protein